MAQNKHLFHKVIDEDFDDEILMSPCFQIRPGVQLKEVPTTGEEYLLKVIKERKSCLAVTKCDRDYFKFSKNQSCFIEEEPQTAAPEKFKPTIEWQNFQVADFSELRSYISKMRLKTPKGVQVLKRECIRNWQHFFKTEEPTLCCMLGLNGASLHSGLNFFVSELEQIKYGDSIDKRTGLWIYAFLACLSQPLLADTISILRSIARRCAIIRSHIEYEEEVHPKIAPLNILICLISRYFRQYDLCNS